MPEISKLSDYPAIKKLASALYKFDASQHGAAIMIGAGFSRSAARHVGGEKKMPLWNDFSKRLVEALNPNDKDFSFSDPLHVAEEFRAYFGQASLSDRIRFEINDDAWQPGILYSSLLKLPWAEVMTTNWDTLLERAAKDVHGPFYTPVTKPSDLAWAPSPRIVKLHGTIGVTDSFIVAQEDYRTYPEKYAPFVNFARQVFIEHELCLVGFSGDDPNFLHWAGWVRDHLGDYARKIYLVGALKLSASQRVYLESINISPVDLWSAVRGIDDSEIGHQKAIELFLEAIRNEGKSRAKPYEWMPRDLQSQQATQQDHIRQYKEPEYAATLLKGQLETLQKDHESYPGWLVCPPSKRWQIRTQLRNPFPNCNNIAALEPDDRAKLLYEIAWRHSITFEYVHPWLVEAFFEVASPDRPCALSKRQQMEIALVLLKNSRWLEANDEVGKQAIEEHIQTLNSIFEKYAPFLPDGTAELSYHRALVSRDRLNYEGIESMLEKITGEDPVWKLRQASLLMELGRFDEGAQLIAKAYGELRDSHRRDRYSITILSRLVWSHWLLNAAHSGNFNETLEELPAFAESNYRKWKCDPWTWIEDIQESVRKRQDDYLKNQNSIEPLFDQGYYRNNSINRSNNNDISEFLLLEGLSRSVGIPLRSGGAGINVNLLAGTVEKLVLSGGIGTELFDYTLAIRAASSESSLSINGIFTRIGLACASKEVVATLVDRTLSAIIYWRNLRSRGTKEQRSHALSVLRVLMEVLARLVIRVSPEKAAEIFRLSVSLGQQQDFQHPQMFEVIEHLLAHSLKSIPESKQGELLPDALAFPLPSEVMSSNPNLPNPVISHPNERRTYAGIDKRIGELIAAVMSESSTSSSAALFRLLPLIEKENFLSSIEHKNLATALWGNTPDYKRLPNTTGLLPHALLLLPAPDENKVKTLVQRHLYEHDEDVLTDTQKELRVYPSPEIQRAVMIYAGMANAAANAITRLLPSTEQALMLFERLMKWRPRKSSDGSLGFAGNERKRLTDSIGNALSYAIVPALTAVDKTVERFQQLQALYTEVDGANAALPAFIYFASINDGIACAVEKLVRKALQSRDADEVAYAAIALQKWSELSVTESSPQFNGLVSRLIVIIESGRTVGLQQLLSVAGELFKKKLLSDDQVTTLRESVTDAYDAADYVNIEPNSREAISASSIREQCVKLAKTFYDQFPDDCSLTDMLNKSKTDTLPEVRFAIESE